MLFRSFILFPCPLLRFRLRSSERRHHDPIPIHYESSRSDVTLVTNLKYFLDSKYTTAINNNNLEQSINVSQKDVEKKKKEVEKLKKDITVYEKNIKKAEENIKKANSNIDKLSKEIETLNQSIKQQNSSLRDRKSVV